MKCYICGCTDRRECSGGCNWAHGIGELPLCSVCWRFQEAMTAYVETARATSKASLARMFENILRKMRGADAARC